MTSQAALQLVLVFLILVLFFSIAVSIVTYIFEGIGGFVISRRRKLGTSAFAWIPILKSFKFGQIADDAIFNKSGKRSHFMIFYPIFMIAGSVIFCVASFIMTLSVSLPYGNFSDIIQYPEEYFSSAPQITSQTGFVISLILLMIGFIIMIAASVMKYVCCFHIFKSCSTKYIVMFILSFVFPILVSIFLFAIRMNDNPVYYIPGRNGSFRRFKEENAGNC